MLTINNKTVRRRSYRKIFKKVIYDMITELCMVMPFEEAINIVSKYYKIKKKAVKAFLKFTNFDQDVICVIPDRINGGREFINHCSYIFIIYRSINKMIYKLFYDNNLSMVQCIRAIGEILTEYDPNGNKIVFNAIKMELRKQNTKYKRFYLENLDSQILKMFEDLHFHDKAEKLLNKI